MIAVAGMLIYGFYQFYVFFMDYRSATTAQKGVETSGAKKAGDLDHLPVKPPTFTVVSPDRQKDMGDYKLFSFKKKESKGKKARAKKAIRRKEQWGRNRRLTHPVTSSWVW